VIDLEALYELQLLLQKNIFCCLISIINYETKPFPDASIMLLKLKFITFVVGLVTQDWLDKQKNKFRSKYVEYATI